MYRFVFHSNGFKLRLAEEMCKNIYQIRRNRISWHCWSSMKLSKDSDYFRRCYLAKQKMNVSWIYLRTKEIKVENQLRMKAKRDFEIVVKIINNYLNWSELYLLPSGVIDLYPSLSRSSPILSNKWHFNFSEFKSEFPYQSAVSRRKTSKCLFRDHKVVSRSHSWLGKRLTRVLWPVDKRKRRKAGLLREKLKIERMNSDTRIQISCFLVRLFETTKLFKNFFKKQTAILLVFNLVTRQELKKL